MEIKDRHVETKKISGVIWSAYVSRLNTIPAGVNDAWWDKTVELFNAYQKQYRGTTHEKYVNHYVMACLDDLGEICKERKNR